MEEIWVDIENYEGTYQVSNMANVKSLSRIIEWNGTTKLIPEKVLKVRYEAQGYQIVSLSINDYEIKHKVHRLVAKAFIPNTENKPYINHKNGNKKDNSIDNLEWCTPSENVQHAYDTGLASDRSGKNHPQYGKVGGQSANAKIVLDLQTGIFYDCVKDAAKAKNLNFRTLSAKLGGSYRGKNKNDTSLIYA